jgi:transposase-like protein
MRYSASDKIEIIRLVEQSHLPARRTLEKLGIPRSSFYRWYDQYQGGGPEGLADRPSRPDRVWNRIPEAIRSQIVDLALDQPELSPRELAVRFTDEAGRSIFATSLLRGRNLGWGLTWTGRPLSTDHQPKPPFSDGVPLSSSARKITGSSTTPVMGPPPAKASIAATRSPCNAARTATYGWRIVRPTIRNLVSRALKSPSLKTVSASTRTEAAMNGGISIAISTTALQ